jgi:hypothetical protein
MKMMHSGRSENEVMEVKGLIGEEYYINHHEGIILILMARLNTGFKSI